MMDQNVLSYVEEKTMALIDAPTCSQETKAAAQSWLAAKGTDAQAAETRRYIQELEADIMPIDTLISFAQSEEGKTYFGEDTATGIAAHAKEIKAAGAKYCDCPACAIVAEILEKMCIRDRIRCPAGSVTVTSDVYHPSRPLGTSGVKLATARYASMVNKGASGLKTS